MKDTQRNTQNAAPNVDLFYFFIKHLGNYVKHFSLFHYFII